jgi:CubicO group peptidase (beta-lactamase class C family)
VVVRTGLLLSVVVACSQRSLPAEAPPAIVGAATPAVVTPAPVTPTSTIVTDQPPVYRFEDPERRKKLAAAFPAIDRMIDEELAAQSLPGIALGIVIDGELVYTKGAGVTSEGGKTPPDVDTVYRIGSITKSFTGLALLALRDEGALDLDDPLAKWVPGAAKLVYPTKDARPITLRQLSNHTSGLPRMGPFAFEESPTAKIVDESLASVALELAPGLQAQYSNLGFGLLGIAVGHAGKSSYHDIVEQKIWKPLGMSSTSWDHTAAGARLAPAYDDGPKGRVVKPVPARLGAVDGAGGIFSSVRDMARYVAFQLSAYPARSDDDRGPIKRATLREAHSTGVPWGFKHDPPAVASSYGFGWTQFQTCELDDLIAHNGAIDSYRSDLRFSPSRGVGVIALTNFGNGNPSAFTEKALAELAKTGALAQRVPEPSPLLAKAVERLLVSYHAWDEAAFAKILAREVDPREKDELATYKQLHGNCTTFVPGTLDTPTSGSFVVKCERGILELQVNVSSTGLIQGFFGRSTGVDAPPGFAAVAKELVALSNKWDDRRAAKLFAAGPPIAQRKSMRDVFFARHGECKIVGTLHVGFEWGMTLACTKEDVEVMVFPPPDAPGKIAGLQLRPRPDAPKHCPK